MRIRKGFTLIELMIVVAIIAVIAAIAIPNLMSSRMASNEASAIAGLRAYLGAQGTFQRVDRYALGRLLYANSTDGVGYRDLFDLAYDGLAPAATAIKLIDMSFAKAAVSLGAATVPKAGYVFDDIESDNISGAYDYSNSCGLAAGPGAHGKTGINSFVIDMTGTVYKKDLTVSQTVPVVEYPDTTTDTWLPVGN